MGFGEQVSSFGREKQQKVEELPPPPGSMVMLPPLVLPPVQVPMVLVIDDQALGEAAARIQAMVATAVAAGIREGMDLSNVDSVVSPDSPFQPTA